MLFISCIRVWAIGLELLMPLAMDTLIYGWYALAIKNKFFTAANIFCTYFQAIHIIVTFLASALISFILVITIEFPFGNLERLLLPKPTKIAVH